MSEEKTSFLINCSPAQKAAYEKAAMRMHYMNFSAWVRDMLDDAANYDGELPRPSDDCAVVPVVGMEGAAK